MSIKTALENLKSKIDNAYSALEKKGAVMPETKNAENLSATIDSIVETQPDDDSNKFGIEVLDYDTSGCEIQLINIPELDNNTSLNIYASDISDTGEKDIQKLSLETDNKCHMSRQIGGNTLIYINASINSSSTNDSSYIVLQHVSKCIRITCFLKGTLINTKNGLKPIEELTYDDEILAWDFDNGQYAYVKPLWLKRSQTTDHYYVNTFESGKTIKTTGEGAGHRFFNLDTNRFEYNTDCIGHAVYTVNGPDVLKSVSTVDEPCEFYNIITEYHLNAFADDILTGFRYCNIYPVEQMAYVKSKKTERDIAEFNGISEKWIYGMRCLEQIDSAENIIKYITDRILISK